MTHKMYTFAILGALLALPAFADPPSDAELQAHRAAESARASAETARESALAAREKAEIARADAQHELEQMRGQMRELSRKMAELSRRMGDVGPRNYAYRYLGDPDRGMIGLVLAPDERGLRVQAVTPGGPADKAGVRDGDVLLAIDGKKLAGDDAARDTLHDLKIGQQVKLVVAHDGKSRDIALKAERREPADFAYAFGDLHDLAKLGAGGWVANDVDGKVRKQVEIAMRRASDATARAGDRARFALDNLNFSTPWWGLNLASLNPDLGGYFGTDQGVLVLSADADSFKGLKSGDIVQDVSGHKVTRPEDALRLLREAPTGSEVKVQVLRQRKPLLLSLKTPSFKAIFVPPPPPPAPAPPAPPAMPASPAVPAPAPPPPPPPPPPDDQAV